MPADTHLISSIYDAALAPQRWPEVLDSLAQAVGAVGAGYIVRDKRTGRVDHVVMTGPHWSKEQDYAGHYVDFDIYWPILDAAPSQSWVRLSECLPDAALRGNAWYNEFLRGCGVGDILGMRLFDTWSHTAVIGLEIGVQQAPLPSASIRQREALFAALAKAARLHHEVAGLAAKSAVARVVLDQLATGVVVADHDGWIVEMNHAAEQTLRADDGLTARGGQLCARRVFEANKLARLIAGATGDGPRAAARMLIGRQSGKPSYVLTVVPVRGAGLVEGRPLALILIVDQDLPSLSGQDLTDLFGLTAAERRLAAALMDGRKLQDIAGDSGLKITTLRTQLRSVLRKVGVQRQADLARALSTIRSIRSAPV